ncbi:MAG: ABC transporter substrate-binding protein [Solirubrobacterales bacterium]
MVRNTSAARRLATLATSLVVLLALVACGKKSETGQPTQTPISVALDWFPNPDHVGIFSAIDRGRFMEAGLEVGTTPPPPADPSLPIKQAARGQVDLAVTYEPEVYLAREQGLDVVAVAALAQRPLTSLVSLPKGKIRKPSDLEGKRIATAGIPYQEAYLKSILAEADLTLDDVKTVSVGDSLQPPLLSGKVDAVLGMFWNVEGVELKERKKKPRIQPVDELGVPAYDELVLVTSRKRLEEDPESLRLFIAALARGTEDAERNPGRAVNALLDANPDLDRKLTRAEVDATLPVLKAPGDKPFGHLDRAEWQAFGDWMRDQKLIAQPANADEALSTDLLTSGPDTER